MICSKVDDGIRIQQISHANAGSLMIMLPCVFNDSSHLFAIFLGSFASVCVVCFMSDVYVLSFIKNCTNYLFFFKLPAKLHNYLEMSKYLSKNFDFYWERGRFCEGRSDENRQKGELYTS